MRFYLAIAAGLFITGCGNPAALTTNAPNVVIFNGIAKLNEGSDETFQAALANLLQSKPREPVVVVTNVPYRVGDPITLSGIGPHLNLWIQFWSEMHAGINRIKIHDQPISKIEKQNFVGLRIAEEQVAEEAIEVAKILVTTIDKYFGTWKDRREALLNYQMYFVEVNGNLAIWFEPSLSP